MKALSKLALLALAIIFVSVARTYGASGNLEGPSVALPGSLTQADRDKIHAALQRKDCKFVSGSFLNKDSQLHYMSDTESLGKFLEELTKCPGVRIHIGFYKPGPNAMWAVDGSNWSVFHSATDNSFSVKIRLGSDIDLTRLYLPPLASTTDKDATAKPKRPKLPDEAYTTTGIHCQKFRDEDANRPGGELMGRVMESERSNGPLVLGMRVASDAKWNIGGQARVELVIRNVGGSDLKFAQTPRADNGLSVVAIDKDGKEHQAEIAQFDGLLVSNHLILPRSHVVMVKSFTLRFDPEKRDVSKPGVAAFHLPPGDYRLRCKWSDAHPDVVHEGEWTGELASVKHKFTLAAAPAVPDK